MWESFSSRAGTRDAAALQASHNSLILLHQPSPRVGGGRWAMMVRKFPPTPPPRTFLSFQTPAAPSTLKCATGGLPSSHKILQRLSGVRQPRQVEQGAAEERRLRWPGARRKVETPEASLCSIVGGTVPRGHATAVKSFPARGKCSKVFCHFHQ